MDRTRRLIAETAGTAFLVLVGCGSIVATGASEAAAWLVPVAFFAAVAVPVLIVGPVSGAHLNPAVTLALAARRRFPRREAPGYVAAQLVGAVAAAFVLRFSVGEGGIGATVVRTDIGNLVGFAAEAVATGILVLVILVVVTGPRLPPAMQAGAIGATVGLAAWLIGPWTGASLNPARSLGPALLSGPLDLSIVLYLTAPVIGGVVGATLACTLLPSRLCCQPVIAPPKPIEVTD